MSAAAAIGRPLPRVDGPAKVTGAATYAADVAPEGVVHAVLVTSTVASGRITAMDAETAEHAPGVLAVLTPFNAPKLPFKEPEPGKRPPVDPQFGHHLRVLQDDAVRFSGQPIGVVVAETLEQAVFAASLVRATYTEEPHATELEARLDDSFAPTKTGQQGPAAEEVRGDRDALGKAEVTIDARYVIPTENHNPIETHATVAHWQDGKLTLYDKTQWVSNVRRHVADTFGLDPDDVRVVSPYVGGAFGSGLRPWPHVLVAAMAAQRVGRPVKLVVSREQMYTATGHRPHTVQRVGLGATHDGRLTAIRHEGIAETSTYEEYTESLLTPTKQLYACPNVVTRYGLVRLNINTPTWQRAPGEVSGTYALECAMDELAGALRLDPVELRLRNHADADPESGRPWSSKSLKECYRQGAERFGWSRRDPEPRSMRAGRYLIGQGMASAVYPTHRSPTEAFARLEADGTAVVRVAASDMGPGTWTSMTQIAADALGLPPERVRFALGDSAMPRAPAHGGSTTLASVGSAVHEACLALRNRLIGLAVESNASPLAGLDRGEIAVEDGRMVHAREPARGETYAEALRRAGLPGVEVMHKAAPGDESKRFAMSAFGAHFVEVRVDPDLGEVRVARAVGAFAAGRIVNPETAHSQAIGGMVMGIGMALMERTELDHRFGRITNPNLSEYLVPVCADIPRLEAFYVEEHDPHVNPLGAKGLAELSITGMAAAVANAVHHATGRRVRDLPIRPEDLL